MMGNLQVVFIVSLLIGISFCASVKKSEKPIDNNEMYKEYKATESYRATTSRPIFYGQPEQIHISYGGIQIKS